MAQVAGLDLTGLSFSERLRTVKWAAEMGRCPTVDQIMGMHNG